MKEECHYRGDVARGLATAELERQLILTGDHVANASSSFDHETNMPQVNITLDSLGGTMMQRATSNNIGRRMGVMFIENRSRNEIQSNESGAHDEVYEYDIYK